MLQNDDFSRKDRIRKECTYYGTREDYMTEMFDCNLLSNRPAPTHLTKMLLGGINSLLLNDDVILYSFEFGVMSC